MKLKLSLLLIAFIGCWCTAAFGADITLQWDANTESNLAGYYVHYKADSCCEPYNGTAADQGRSPLIILLDRPGFDPDNPEFTLTGLDDNRPYYFAVTAYDKEGNESGFSNEVATKAPQVTSPPTVTYVSNDNAVIEWYTDVAGDSEVRYATTPSSWNAYPFKSVDDNISATHSPEPHPEHVQGQTSAQFESAHAEYLILNDTAATNLPWKSNAATKNGTVWIKFRIMDIGKRPVLFAKYDRGLSGRIMAFYITPDGEFQVNLGYNDGNSFKSHFHGTVLQENRWYAASVVFEQKGGNSANPEKIHIRIREVESGGLVGVDYSTNAFDDPDNHELALKSVPYTIGGSLNAGIIENGLNGYLDEIVLSNAVLAEADFNAYVIGPGVNTSDSRFKCVLNFEEGEDFANDATANNNNFTLGGNTPELNYHSVVLTGLDSNSVYYFRVGSTNDLGYGPELENGDANPSAEYSFKTQTEAQPDTTAPQLIVQPYASGITLTTAAIKWVTDEPATSIVEYGRTTTYGLTQSLPDRYVTDHSVDLKGLVGGTTYHYRVTSADWAGNTITSKDVVLTTITDQDTVPPQFTASPTVTSFTHNSFTVEWTTNENSDSRVQFGTASQWWGNYPSQQSAVGLVTHHRVTVTGLTGETAYFFRVGSADSSGNGPTISKELTMKTKKEPDTTAPQIVSPATVISKTDTTATIVWDTNEPGNSELQYGTDSNVLWGAYASHKNDAVLVSHHVVTLTNLMPNKAYFFRVGSTDSSGNGPNTDSQDNNPTAELQFSTAANADENAPQITLPPTVTAINHNSMTVEWTTDEAGNSIVRYGKTSSTWNTYPSSQFDPAGVTRHRVIISGLESDATYYFRVGSSDLTGNGPNTSPEDNNPSVEIVARTTSEVDFEAPQIISPPTVTAKADSVAIIEWTTDEPSNSLVQYGQTPSTWNAYPANQNLSSMVTRHIVALTELSANTTYYFRVGSVDEHGNGPAPSFEVSFTTNAFKDENAPVVVLPPTVTAITDTKAFIEWQTDEPSNSVIKFKVYSDTDPEELNWEHDEQAGVLSVSQGSMVTLHGVTLTNLQSVTRYRFRVGSTDAAGNGPETNLLIASGLNETETNNPFVTDTFTTAMVKDATAPKIIAGPVTSATDNNSATIEWETDEPSTSMVKYGIQESIQTQEEIGATSWERLPWSKSVAELKTLHRVTITGLNPVTAYTFRVGSTDVLGNGPDLNFDPTNASALGTFETTQGPDEAAPKITDTQVFFVTNNTALITWETDEPSNSMIKYIDEATLDALGIGTTWEEIPLSENDAEATRHHSVTVTGVQPETKYLFRVGSTDFKGNGPDQNADESNPSNLLSFTTSAGADRTAPQIIGDVEITTIGDKYVVLEWVTDEPGNSQVQYSNPESDRPGEAGSNSWGDYPLSENDAEMVTLHKVTISGMTPNSLYYFRVSATDAAGNNHAVSSVDKNPSIEYNLETKGADPPSIVLLGNKDYPNAYPKIDYVNNTLDITYDESNMKNARGEGYYLFSPSLNFSIPGVSVQELSNGNGQNAFRFYFKSIPIHTKLALKLTEDITDADNNQVVPDSVILNDLDGDDLPDDWEVAWGLNPRSGNADIGEGKLGDFDGDGNSNFTEFLNGTDPKDFSSFLAGLPRIVRSVPFYHIDSGPTQNVPVNTAFGALVVDKASGINITDNDSIRFIIDDGVNEAYTVNLVDVPTVRIVKLIPGESDDNVSALWAVYDRTRERQTALKTYPFEASAHVVVKIKNNKGNIIRDDFYYTIETKAFHDQRLWVINETEIKTIDDSDPDIDDPDFTYDTGIEVISGPLAHTKLIYDSEHPVSPIVKLAYGSREEVEPATPSTEVFPPTVFSPPAKLIFPILTTEAIDKLDLYFKEGDRWVRACDTGCNVDSSGYGWMVPGSRVNRNNSNPPSIEIKIYHSTASFAGLAVRPPSPIAPTEEDERAEANCFVDSLR